MSFVVYSLSGYFIFCCFFQYDKKNSSAHNIKFGTNVLCRCESDWWHNKLVPPNTHCIHFRLVLLKLPQQICSQEFMEMRNSQ